MAVIRIAHTVNAGTGASTGIDTTASGGATLILIVSAAVNIVPAIVGGVDSAGNTYTALNSLQTGARIVKAWYKVAPTNSASLTVTMQDGQAMNTAIVALNPASPVFDTQNAGGTSGTTTVQPGSLTPGGATNLIFATLGGDANTSIAINSSYNTGESSTNTPYGPQGVALGWLEQSSATAQNPTWTVGANGSTLNSTAFSFTFTGSGGPTFVFRPGLNVKQAVNRAGTY